MSLTLHFHPLASYCWKALIALYEKELDFELRMVNLGDPAGRAAFAALWPIAKMPVLEDAARGAVVPETSIIVEYLQLAHPGPVRLLPDDLMAALDVRFLDRFFDLYVMGNMQVPVADRLRPEGTQDALGVERARQKLHVAYDWLEGEIGDAWAAGDRFTLADCAAAPSLFYADWVEEIGDSRPRLKAYRGRLLAHPVVARAVDEGRPYRAYFPLGAPDRD